MRRLHLFLILIASFAIALVFAPLAFAADEPIDNAEDLAAWASITGILLPILIAVVVRHKSSAQTKMIVAVAIAIVDGVVVTGLTHGWHFDGHLLVTVAGVLALSQVTYRNVWLKLGDTATPSDPAPSEPVITKLERATG
jgi:prolipoprotein diacylglyceryltransferase